MTAVLRNTFAFNLRPTSKLGEIAQADRFAVVFRYQVLDGAVVRLNRFAGAWLFLVGWLGFAGRFRFSF